MSLQAPRGTNDIYGSYSQKWGYVISVIQNRLKRYDYHQIITPTFELTDVFKRGIGETTDIVGKEMYTFEDRGGRSLTLRPEGTASVARAYVERGMDQLLNKKFYYIAPMFRYEKPQKGRYREHYQFGVESFGNESPLMDAEVIDLLMGTYRDLGLSSLEVKLNSVGCRECRPGYESRFEKFIHKIRSSLCEECKNRSEKNPLRILDCKNPNCKKVLQDTPQINKYLCEECGDHFSVLQTILTKLNIPFQVDSKLVRGLDYYTKTVFEITSGGLGSQNAVGGGGRYDNLLESFGAKKVPAVGFGCGLERLLMVLESENVNLPIDEGIDVFVGGCLDSSLSIGMKKLQSIRELGFSGNMDFRVRNLKKHLQQASKLNARCALIFAEDEYQEEKVIVKNMAEHQQEIISWDNVEEFLTEWLKK